MKFYSKSNKNVWFFLGAVVVLIIFLAVTMPNTLPSGMARMMGMNRSKVTRRYITMPELQQKMAQVSQAYKQQRGMRL